MTANTQDSVNTNEAAAHVVAHNLSVEAGKTRILHDVSVSVNAGEVVGLIGPNGAGKSTLLAALAGDMEPVTGLVELRGRTYREWSAREAAQHRAVMLQDTVVAYSFSVRDVVTMGRHAWTADKEDEQAVADAIERMDLHDLVDRDVTTLSGGERARVALARVLAQQAECVILDEPTAAMDIRHQELTGQLIGQLAKEGRSVIVVLHDLEVAARLCDRLVLLKRGRVVAQGTPAEVCTPETLSAVYDWPLSVTRDQDGHLRIKPRH